MHLATWLGSGDVVIPIAILVVLALLTRHRIWLALFVAIALAGSGLLVLVAKNVAAR